MKPIHKGAEADIFLEKAFGRTLAVKARNPKRYRVESLDRSLRKTRTKREAKAMYLASRAGINVPALYAIGRFSMCMEWIEGKLMKDSRQKQSVYVDLGEQLGLLHKAGIAHGDFTTANVLIKEGKPYLIDFGLSEITTSIEEKAIDLILMKRSISKRDFSAMTGSYVKAYPDARKVLDRLSEIEERGRYKTRTLG
ncbi:MAG: Kae1-associated serine/threonine protein kinase [Candidatus Micrarchaeota archaeon]|nr:Kae1-associated serine/threonine protein kinase [Candidatus Micrarchaeota archaeon]